MDVAKRVYDVCSRWDPFLVNIEFWSKIPPHRRMRLSDPRRFLNNGIQDGRFRFPSFEGYARQLSGKERRSCVLGIELQMEVEQRPNFRRRLVAPFGMSTEERY